MKSLLSLLRKPTAETLAQIELEEAKRQLSEAQSNAEYRNAMVEYHRRRIARLQTILQGVAE